jgi:Immunity protein Imm1
VSDTNTRPRQARVGFGNGDPDQIVTTPAELDAALDQLDSEARRDGQRYAFISLDDETGLDMLSIGVGADLVPLSHTDERPDGTKPWDVQSRGDRTASGSSEWGYMNTWNEVPNRLLVPADSAREAARRWFQTGQRPDNITWATWDE